MRPRSKKYFILSSNDDATGVMGNMSANGGWWQLFLTTAGTIMVINSILLGVITGVALRAFIDPQLLWIVLGGLLAFGISLALHYMYQVSQWSNAAKRGPALFPSDPGDPGKSQPGNEAEGADIAGR